MIVAHKPAVVLAPMEGLTDAPMRAVQSELGTFTFAVGEFIRISANVPSKAVFLRHVPELMHGGRTCSGLPVYVQILGGNAERMAQAAVVACDAGAKVIDINFGCPAPTVNSHDGGATLLKYPSRIREIVRAVRSALPAAIPVSAKLRLGWDNEDAVYENAQMAAEGGASWITIHGRTRNQGYNPPVSWRPIGIVREQLNIPVVANGDLWTMAAFRRCQQETGCIHYMLGRSAMANPHLSHQIAEELGIAAHLPDKAHGAGATAGKSFDWRPFLQKLINVSDMTSERSSQYMVRRLKQWLKIAEQGGNFPHFDAIKRSESVEELFGILAQLQEEVGP